MARQRTVDLLPEIFQTTTNRKFLSATLDQLTQESNFQRIQGFVGRRVGAGVNPSDNYVTEPDAVRSNYQLEPGVTFFDPGTQDVRDVITYPGMLDSLELQGANTVRQDRLWSSEYYAWDPFCDLDKFNNYSQYYWLPGGPDAVDVSSSQIPVTDDFTVSRSLVYRFSGLAGDNPEITLVRGGNYTFLLNQVGHQFWIQSQPGVSGRLAQSPNISSRDVFGVINNGEDQGDVKFYVPTRDAQDFYYNLTEASPVDLVADRLRFADINNKSIEEFFAANPSGIDGITDLDQRTVIFTNRITGAEAGGWQIISGSSVTDITSLNERYSVWRINYVGTTIVLDSVRNVADLTKLSVLFGSQWSTTVWYKDAGGFYDKVPLLTAPQDILYYQDSTNPEIFGRIRLVDSVTNVAIDLDEIVGAKNYTSPNGVTFTNGLKITFRGNVSPASYQDQEFYVEGVGTGPGINSRVGFVDGRSYFGDFHVYQGQKRTGKAYDANIFQQNIYDTLEDSLANPGAGGPARAALPQDSVVGAAQGSGIVLVPTRSLLTPETYTRSLLTPYDSVPYDVGGFDDTLDSPAVPDYITINRASADGNAWSRSNRWFHIDVLRYSAERNNSEVTVNNEQRAKRPIIEFRADLRLYNSGTQAKPPVNIIDFQETDALSNINGQTGYGVDGYDFLPGSLVIFAADLDDRVRNNIYRVDLINPDGDPNSPDVIHLVPIINGTALINQMVVSLNGANQQGVSHWFNGSTWQRAQHKTGVNQPPLFDVFDTQGRSFADLEVYPSSTFAGSKLFGYAVGETITVDEVLGFPLRFVNIVNVGDIAFENYFYNDIFIYVENNSSITTSVSNGFARQYIDRVSFSDQLGWQTAAQRSRSRQTFRFSYNQEPLLLGLPIDMDTVFAPVQVFVEGVFLDPSSYTITVSDINTVIVLNNQLPNGTTIEVLAYSNQASPVGFYQVPNNLENNSINGNSSEFTLGSIRAYYESVATNLRDLVGPINGSNNSRDLGNIIPFGTRIVQHSSPMLLTGTFLRQRQYDLFESLAFNSNEYTKYKARMLDLASRGDFINLSPTQILDTITQEISITRTESSPFYWSDMLPAGEDYTELRYVYGIGSTNTFDVTQSYNFTASNYQSMLVYLNGILLTIDYDYTVPVDGNTVTILRTLTQGDVVVIREYATTFGSFVPNTPTKLGLYPAYRPEMYLEASYIEPTMVIRGHDGSITVAYGDFRDQVLLEFEIRIFNNLKIKSDIPLEIYDVAPGQFRSTAWSQQEITSLLLPDFLSWVGQNRLNYTNQTYNANQAFTYNYSQSGDRLDGAPLLGAWRGIYNYFYDTTNPNIRPWEMLGFTQEPNWWSDAYGPAPYTDGNLVLWQDLEQGFIADPVNPRYDARFARPGLTSVIPSGSEGELLPPLRAVVGNYDATSFRRSWTFGDDGPVENVWRTSSAWPFAVMRLLALTRPAEFFSLFVDRDRYLYDNELGQYLWDARYRLQSTVIAPLYGSGVSRASYINWIVDYNQQRGLDSSANLAQDFEDLDVRLCYRMAGFSDKRYLKVFTERSTPSGTNTSLLLPDESYQLLLYQNAAFEKVNYSSVIVQTVEDGWAVFGYNLLISYFDILQSKPFGRAVTVSAGGSNEQVSVEYSDTVIQVPYGFVFRNRAAVCDFFFSYGKLLEQRGFEFEGYENGYVLNWPQMAQEFLYWSNQGWSPGSIINLNPGATKISITRPGAVVESLGSSGALRNVLNQNQQPVKNTDVVIDRLENTFAISSLNSNTLCNLDLRFTSYEHVMVLDNRSIFADLIYDPVTGLRQNRVRVSGWLSGDWNGTVDVPGFVLNQPNIQEWNPNLKYAKGQIVRFKDQLWSASTLINPSPTFDFNLWLASDYNEVQQGLLPNAANASNQLADAYNTYVSNLEQEVNLFSYGLIGFRPRNYMQALNLDDVSQVNLYQQFLGSKGTRGSLELFSLADLGKETAEYDIFENWAILTGTYGANANRQYFELVLNPARLTSNPSTIQIIEPGQSSRANQSIFVVDIWDSSNFITSPDILPVTTVPPDRALPSAGYVNLDDVDITVFDLESTGALSLDLNTISEGTTIWAARVNTYDWNVYRCEKCSGVIIRVADNLDALSLVTFDDAHELDIGDTLIIKNFDDDINGAYIVQRVTGVNSVLINYQFQGFQTSVTGIGLGLRLESARVSQPSDIAALPYARDLRPGARVWVNDNGQGLWTVLEKDEPFTAAGTLSPQTNFVISRFGESIAQGLFNLTSFIGAPGYNPSGSAVAPGAVYPFVRTDQDVYAQSPLFQLNANSAAGFGNALDVGSQTWAVIGAVQSNNGAGYAVTVYAPPGSTSFTQTQLLVAPDQEFDSDVSFGYAVTMSQNERWLYVGAPGRNRVYAYARQDVQNQSISYITTGTQNTFNYSNFIELDVGYPRQLLVVLDNVILDLNDDYTLNTTEVVLTFIPTSGQRITLVRRPEVQLDQTLHRDVVPIATSGVGDGARFTVNNVRGVYSVELSVPGENYTVADTITLAAADVATLDAPTTNPAFDIIITVDSVDVFGAITDFSVSGTGRSDEFEFDIDQYLTTADNIYSFTVKVNDILQRPHIDYDINDSSAPYTLVFNTVPGTGAVIRVIAETYWQFVDVLEIAGLTADARFGASVSTTTNGAQIIVGAPGFDNDQGRAYVFDRSIQRFVVSDTNDNQFRTVEDLEIPGAVSVSLNGEYLINDQYNINGQYVIDVSNPADQYVEITADSAVGDIVEIETNQFNAVQIIAGNGRSPAAQLGLRLDQCVNDCSLYVSAPFDSMILPQAGAIEFYQNQSRVYGSITSTVANPVLTAGSYIRIDNFFVECTGTNIDDFFADIVAANLSNIEASMLPDVDFQGDGTTRTYAVGDIYSAAESYNTRVLVDNVVLTAGIDYAYNNIAKTVSFTTAPGLGSDIKIVAGRIRIGVKNFDATVPFNRLKVFPGLGPLFDEIGFNVYVWQQTITSPVPQSEAHFGDGLFISNNTTTLLVGAPNGDMILPMTFDQARTTFDLNSMQFFDRRVQSGAVYSFDSAPSAAPSISSPTQFIFGQQFVDTQVQSLDRYGAAIDYTTNVLLIGAPGSDLGDSSSADYGRVLEYDNINDAPAWRILRLQQPVVNIELLNTVFMYDSVAGGYQQFLDFFDPLQGRLLGVVQQNIDFIGAIDPASYNQGSINNFGQSWRQEHVGQIWWDTGLVRFIDPNQDDIQYASRRWGQVFPGSVIQVYQWVSSDVTPDQYIGPGAVRNLENYVVATGVDEQGFVSQTYYFWVSGISEVARSASKTLSTTSLASYIENPRASGISYLAPLSSNTVSIYNFADAIANETILHIEFDQQRNDDAVHVQYQLIPDGRPDGFLNNQLYRKFLDSMTGNDLVGNPVPDPALNIGQRYGIEVRPRQTMVANRFLALRNYLTRSNEILSQFPISETRTFDLLNSREPEPTSSSGAWNQRVVDQEELGYQDLSAVPLGYLYLVDSDSANNGLWTIYQVVSSGLLGGRALSLVRVQNFDTRLYWEYIDWYATDYAPSTRILLTVENRSDLDTLNVPDGSSVRVSSNNIAKWEIYRYSNQEWFRVALENGTIAFKSELWNYELGRFGFDSEVFDAQYYDQAPTIETRKILEAINQELFIDDLAIERNQLLILMFNFILTEQIAPYWLTKTSLIDVDHTIRNLEPFQTYRTDNQDFVLDYINEVKPYHTQIREFNLLYKGQDTYQGSLTDFDVPAYFDTSERQFISPILDNTGQLSPTSSRSSNNPIWQQWPWSQWYQNYTLNVESVTVLDGGSGYLSPPSVTVTGEADRPAILTARINSAGRVVGIDIVDPGQGYLTTALITISGDPGSGAQAVARMGNNQVRGIVTTLRYDRYEYEANVREWQANRLYVTGDLVRYADRVWRALEDDSAGLQSAVFDPLDWQQVPAGELAAADRTMGYYVPGPNDPGLQLSLLISGVEYPGVQVAAPSFDQDTGFDIGNYDMTPFDNISFGPEGRATYDLALLDTIYASNFLDPFLGTRPTDINVSGGAFVDSYESHAPEELVPGITYDTLDLRVYTTPGADWLEQGHGFPETVSNYEFFSAAPRISYAGQIDNLVTIIVYNQTLGAWLVKDRDYTVDWVEQEITVVQNVSSGNVITIRAFGLGGGNQIFQNAYAGTISGRIIDIPVDASMVEDIVVFVNGRSITDFTYAGTMSGVTRLTFVDTWGSDDYIYVAALGASYSQAGASWSTPVTQTILITAANVGAAFTLTNSLQGTNPANLIVNKNGNRVRPPEAAKYLADGVTVEFALPNRGGFNLALVADNDVSVWINNVAQTLGVDFFVDPSDASSLRGVTFASAPPVGSIVLISVRTRAQYWIVGNQIIFQASQGLVPVIGDVITITSWNDTAEQDISTQVFLGPTVTGQTVSQGYDETGYDTGVISGQLGSFDYSEGAIIEINTFDTGSVITAPERLIVSLDGRYLFLNAGFTVQGSAVIVDGPAINANQRVVITSMTNNVVPAEMAFRIFQDMRGSQYTYRITVDTSTELIQPLLATDDIAYVNDASRLGEPELSQGYFGMVTINGERLTYRTRDVVNNTISGFRRGVAGTGAADHAAGTEVLDIGPGNLLPTAYQNTVREQDFLADGTQTVFATDDIIVLGVDSTELAEAVQVYVGGILQAGGYVISLTDPVEIDFFEAPAAGYQVSIRVRQGVTWYALGDGTPSDGIPLQDTDTPAARFLRGLD